MFKYISIARWMIRFGLVFVLSYAAYEAYADPNRFLTYIPDFVTRFVSTDLFLMAFGIGEGILVLWLLSGWHTEYPAILTAFLMAGIVIFNLDAFPILFRNVAIGFSAIALAFLDKVVILREDYNANSAFPNIK